MKTVKQILILIGIAVLIAGAVNLIHPARIPWVEDWANRVEAQAVREKIDLVHLSEMLDYLRNDSRLLVDARPAEEYARGHIPGAISLPFESMDPQGVAQVIASAKAPVFYCSGVECDDSLLLALELRKLGRVDGAIFIGGMDLWRAEMLSIEGDVQ
jgi:rhodanese-related sulfurtransferase